MNHLKLFVLFLTLHLVYSCDIQNNDDQNKHDVKLKKHIKQVVKSTKDFVNNTVNGVIDTFDYHYENDAIKDISLDGRKYVDFVYKNNKVIRKNHYDNLEKLIYTDSIFYDSKDRIKLIKTLNHRSGILGYSIEVIYDLDKPINIKEIFYYPKISFQNYELHYSGANVDSVFFSPPNYTYVYDYYKDDFNPDFELIYLQGPFAINGTTLPMLFSSNRIKYLRRVDSFNNQPFDYRFQHQIIDNYYHELSYNWYDENQNILSATIWEVKY